MHERTESESQEIAGNESGVDRTGEEIGIPDPGDDGRLDGNVESADS